VIEAIQIFLNGLNIFNLRTLLIRQMVCHQQYRGYGDSCCKGKNEGEPESGSDIHQGSFNG
jgi:hypothetical protein